jgi:hypothetical protein
VCSNARARSVLSRPCRRTPCRSASSHWCSAVSGQGGTPLRRIPSARTCHRPVETKGNTNFDTVAKTQTVGNNTRHQACFRPDQASRCVNVERDPEILPDVVDCRSCLIIEPKRDSRKLYGAIGLRTESTARRGDRPVKDSATERRLTEKGLAPGERAPRCCR